jgi:hypothetical protein
MILLSSIPLLGIFFKQLHARWHLKWKTLCHKNKCDDTHVEHTDE